MYLREFTIINKYVSERYAGCVKNYDILNYKCENKLFKKNKIENINISCVFFL